jgi:cation diffusion facilitator CzcD-associated flavoprotein CzcO
VPETAVTPAPCASSAAPRIAIVGSGFAGLGMAIRLQQMGITSFTIYEAASGIGGTWRDNTYPGAACDVPSHLYSFSFEANPAWSRAFSSQAEILAQCCRYARISA